MLSDQECRRLSSSFCFPPESPTIQVPALPVVVCSSPRASSRWFFGWTCCAFDGFFVLSSCVFRESCGFHIIRFHVPLWSLHVILTHVMTARRTGFVS